MLTAIGVAAIAASICLPTAALAQAGTPTLRILVTAGQESEDPYLDLLTAVRARLGVLSMPAELQPVSQAPDPQIAWQTARETNALSVAWLSPDHTQLFFLTPILGSDLRVRDLPDVSEGWVSRCEVVAAVLHAELEQVVGPAGERLRDIEVEVPEERPAPAGKVVMPVSLVFSGGYVPTQIQLGQPILHGGQLAIGVRPGRLFEFQLGLDLGQPAPLDAESATLGERARIERWGFRLGAALRWRAAPPVEFSGWLGALLDLWTIKDLGIEQSDPRDLQTKLDGAASALVQAQFWPAPQRAPILSFFVRGGADVHFQDRSYEFERPHAETLLVRDRITPRLVCGLRLSVDLRR